MNAITRTVSEVVSKILALLALLGAWGVFATAALDGLGIPTPGLPDVLFVAYVH